MKKSLIPGLILPALLLLFVMNGCTKKSDDPVPGSAILKIWMPISDAPPT